MNYRPLNQSLDETSLIHFMNTFYGFGNYAGDYWLVGMEEAGGRTFAEIKKRLCKWQESGGHELEDLPSHAHKMGRGAKYFGENPKWQPTWGKLIRLVLAAERQMGIETAVIKQFQQRRLGRHSSNHCLIELFPLPAKSAGHWIYAHHSTLPFLHSRKQYQTYLAPIRIKHIQQKIKQHQPKAVIFYGWSYRRWWQEIAERPFTKHDNPKCLTAVTNNTLFIVIDHPATTGVTNLYFEQIGSHLNNQFSKEQMKS